MITLPKEISESKHFRILKTGDKSKRFDQFYSYMDEEWKPSSFYQEITPVTTTVYRRPITLIGWIKTLGLTLKRKIFY